METKTLEQRRAEIKDRRAKTCKHFNGLVNKACEIGIEYSTVTDYPPERASQPPYFQKAVACFGADDAECRVTCPKREFYTAEEIEAEDKRREEVLRQYCEDYKNNICPNHKTPVTKRQVGRCIYAMPCGCRLGQGELSAAQP